MMTLLFSVAVTVFMLPSVHAAVCTDNKCIQSLFTLQTCNAVDNTCNCLKGYVPIPSGCAKRPKKPQVLVSPGKSRVVLIGKSASLMCSINQMLTPDVSFVWMKDSTVTSVTTQNYTISYANVSEVGSFSCKVRFTGTGYSLESDYSDDAVLELLTTGAYYPPVVEAPSFAVEGAAYTPLCTGVPFGVTYKFQINDNEPQLPPITYEPSHSTIRCVLDDPTDFKFDNYSKYSEPISRPTVSTLQYYPTGLNLMDSDGTQDVIFKTGTENVMAVCEVAEWTYPEGDIKYTFNDSSNPTPTANGNTYIVPSTVAAKHVITCTASDIANENSYTSSARTVTFSDDYISAPTLTANENPVTEGSSLVLNCSFSQTDKVHYSWTKNSMQILHQKDNIIQFGSVSSNDAGMYACAVKKHHYVVTSNVITVVTVNCNNAISAPTLTTNENPVKEGSSLVLNCSFSQADTVHYSWTKNSMQILHQKENILQFSSVSRSDAGTYVCAVKTNSCVVKSNIVDVTVTSHTAVALSSAILVIGAGMLSFLA